MQAITKEEPIYFGSLTDKQLAKAEAKYRRLWGRSGAIAYSIQLDRIAAEKVRRSEQGPA